MCLAQSGRAGCNGLASNQRTAPPDRCLSAPAAKEKRRMLRVQLSLGIATLLATTSLTQAQTPIERGSYLVNGLLTCGNCHTPRGPGGAFAMDRQLSGGPQEWDRPTYKVRGANITPDKETGIGNWSDADMKRAITTGTRPNGTPLAPIMPYG